MGPFLAIFWTLFLAFLSPFHVEGSDLLVREMAQKWSKNGSKVANFRGVQKWPFWENRDFIICLRAIFSVFVTFFVSILAILQYFAQVATCGFWPKFGGFRIN